MKKLRVAILGSGKIGTDLLMKVERSPYLTCSAFLGRSSTSDGIQKARSRNVQTSLEGIDYIVRNPNCCDLVFDATSAAGHLLHAPILHKLKKVVIDLTPAQVGEMCIPAVNIQECLNFRNVNMVTCGGQASIPIAFAIAKTQGDLQYLEVISSVASKSVGPASRINIDEYIHTTESGIEKFSGAKRCKAILIVNPAYPCILMQTTVLAKVSDPNLDKLKLFLNRIVQEIQSYVPGYEVIVGPALENERLVVTVRVRGRGDYLPEYAGNLDIINCAAIVTAERYALHLAGRSTGTQAAQATRRLSNEEHFDYRSNS